MHPINAPNSNVAASYGCTMKLRSPLFFTRACLVEVWLQVLNLLHFLSQLNLSREPHRLSVGCLLYI